jgi:hypothetical protein
MIWGCEMAECKICEFGLLVLRRGYCAFLRVEKLE